MNCDEYILVNNLKINCKLMGFNNHPKQPTLLVFPGGPGLGYSPYEPYIRFLEQYLSVLYYDPRGCGKSNKATSENDYCLATYISDAYALLQHFNINQVIILGTSYGTTAAINFALQYPTLLAGLMLVTGAPSYHFLLEAKKILAERGTAEQIQVCKNLWQGSFESLQQITEFFQIMAPLYSMRAKATGIQPYSKVNCALEPLNQGFKTQFGHFDFIKQLTAE
ncbi:hypothetical protein BH10PSE19_BH10PSE19_00540 [soil metagenome]